MQVVCLFVFLLPLNGVDRELSWREKEKEGLSRVERGKPEEEEEKATQLVGG